MASTNGSRACIDTSRPVLPSATASGTPALLKATTGSPQDCASRKTRPNDSLMPGKQRCRRRYNSDTFPGVQFFPKIARAQPHAHRPVAGVFLLFAVSGNDQPKVLSLPVKLAAGSNQPGQPLGFNIRSEHGGRKNHGVIPYFPLVTQLRSGLNIKIKIARDDTRCHIGNPAAGKRRLKLSRSTDLLVNTC